MGRFPSTETHARSSRAAFALPETSERRFRPLQWAALNNRVAVATFLLEKGAEVGAKDGDSQTALHWACVRGSLPCAELLLRSGASIASRDVRGYDCAHVAAQYGHTGILYHFKTKWDAHLDALDLDGRSPLHWAAYKGFPDAVKLLLFCDADVARQDKEGCTPLHWAAIRGKSEAAHVLAQAGGLALLEATDSEGSTAAQLATDKGHKSLGGFLAHHQERLRDEARGKSPGAFLNDKGMAVACLALILGLVFLFVHTVVLADGMPNMDVHLAAWSWLVVLSSGAGLFLMYRVSTADPGFVDAAHAAEGFGARGGAKARHEAVNGAAHRRSSSVGGFVGGGGFDGGGKHPHLEHPELRAGNWSALCPTCKIVKPWGTKHCSVTNRCVKRFDHYCPWMGNVIGKKNLRDFVFFLVLETFAMFVAFLVAIARLRQGGPTPGPFTMTYITMFLVFDGAVLFPVGMLTGAQVHQALRNITTNELANAHRYHYLRDADGKFRNPFDRGMANNARAFLRGVENEAAVQRETVVNMREMEGALRGSDEAV